LVGCEHFQIKRLTKATKHKRGNFRLIRGSIEQVNQVIDDLSEITAQIIIPDDVEQPHSPAERAAMRVIALKQLRKS
jgi:hypothetical protein